MPVEPDKEFALAAIEILDRFDPLLQEGQMGEGEMQHVVEGMDTLRRELSCGGGGLASCGKLETDDHEKDYKQVDHEVREAINES